MAIQSPLSFLNVGKMDGVAGITPDLLLGEDKRLATLGVGQGHFQIVRGLSWPNIGGG